jgi:hypothetical protein
MALSQLPTKRIDGIEFIDQRASLYYNKFKYRARFHCRGVTLAWFNYTIDEIVEKIKKFPTRFSGANSKHIMDFYTWKIATKKNKTATVRIEGEVASVFSNDLDLLKTLENIGCHVDYTEVDDTIISGVKYFVREPKHKYRIYLKSKRVNDDFRTKLQNFIERYKDTDTVIIPSGSLAHWLKDDSNYVRGSWSYHWNKSYTSSNYFIDYDDESTLTLFSLMFSGIISKSYKLEKRPDPV